MKKAKKVMILLIVVLALVSAGAGGIYAYQNYQKENLQVEVVSVANLNWGWWGDSTTSYGYVTDDYTQSVFIEDKTVAEVKVAEGDEVKVGDTLLVYDTAELELQIEMKQLEMQGIKNNITLANRELEELKKIKPTSVTPSSPSSSAGSSGSSSSNKQDAGVVMIKVPKRDGDAYNYIDKTAKPYEGSGTIDHPYRFLCTQECYVLGSYLNQLVQKEQVAAFEIWSGNSVSEGTLISCWTVNGMEQSSVGADSKWQVSTHEMMEDGVVLKEKKEEKEEDKTTEDKNNSTEPVYSAEELKDRISEKETELKELAIEQKSARLNLRSLRKSRRDASVKAKIDGVVRSVEDPENPPTDGTAFMEIAGGTGLYLKGSISELMLDQISVGQEISANSWSNGQMYSAEITEISEYPSTNQYGYGEGNPNSSYYSFVAYIADSEGLSNGDDLEISIEPVNTQENQNSLYIDKAYVRTEDGKSYVLKAGEDNRLVKQYIQTGKVISGSAIEIKSGLSEADRIAFPYGKTAKEGIKVVDPENS